MNMRIKISPVFDALYYSYYFQGMISLGYDLRFSNYGFPKANPNLLLFSIENMEGERKICVIDAMDTSEINYEYLECCDIYGKINFLESKIQNELLSKVIPIGPSFGIKVWSPLTAARIGLKNLLMVRMNINEIKKHLSGYRAQYRYRSRIKDYKYEEPQPDYVFSLNSIWKREANANKYRKNFILACKEIGSLNFEGGFAPRSNNDVMGFEDLTISRRYNLQEYIEKTKKSVIVFNTPAVLGCLGWKLGEFLALGKCIISTPISRELPIPLQHGENIHFIDGSERSIKDAILLIIENPSYRKKLEIGARSYYETLLAPEKVIQRLIDTVFDN